jgi:hypothetical protein
MSLIRRIPALYITEEQAKTGLDIFEEGVSTIESEGYGKKLYNNGCGG